MQVISRVELGLTNQTSDKVYIIEHRRDGDGDRVVCFGAARGKGLREYNKTPDAVSPGRAEQIAEKVVKEKLKKGYQIEGRSEGLASAPAMMQSEKFIAKPMLLNPASVEEAMELVKARPGAFAAQIKFDGERRGIDVDHVGVAASNRRGASIIMNAEMAEVFGRLSPDTIGRGFTLDTEDMGQTIKVFDVLKWEGQCLKDKPLSIRVNAMKAFAALVQKTGAESKIQVALPVAQTAESLSALISKTRADNEEGIVLKDLNSPYREGRPNSGGPWRKIKYVEDIEVLVAQIVEGKRSVEMWIKTPEGPEFWLNCGRVGVPSNYPMPEVGEVAKVEYLYAYAGGKLIQPVWKGIRRGYGKDDVACVSDLKFKKFEGGKEIDRTAKAPLDMPLITKRCA